MNDLLIVIAALAAGAYFAEEIRDVVPVLDRSPDGEVE